MPDFRYRQTTATLDVRGFEFRAAGRQPIDLGWRAAFPEWQPADEKGDEAQLLPPLRNGETAQLQKVCGSRFGWSASKTLEVAQWSERLAKARTVELELRTEKRNLEEREKARDLEMARKLDEERVQLQLEISTRLEEDHARQVAEKDKRLSDAMKANDELRRKLQQGSQQLQGEVLELALEDLISQTFPSDQVQPVPKGINGADIIQRVHNPNGDLAGSIIWESKRTKAWSDGWIQKIKDDQRQAKADIAIMVSDALPKDCSHFKQISGIWVTHPRCAIHLAAALRLLLLEVASAKRAAVGKNEKMEILYAYLSGIEFRQKVDAIVEAFVTMQEDLQEERRSTERRWAKREKTIQRVISNTSGMYGDLQGLVGSSLATIPALTAGELIENL